MSDALKDGLALKDPNPRAADEAGAITPSFLADVEAAIEAGDSRRLRTLAGDLHEADLGGLIEALDPDMRPKLIALMGEGFDFAALTELPDAIRETLLEDLPTATVVEGVRDLESDDAAAILDDLDESEREEILAAMPASERIEIERSLDYPVHSAGRLMQTTLIAVPASWTAVQTLDSLRERDPDHLPDSFFEVFVTDSDGGFLGTVFLDALVRAPRLARVDSIMQADRRRVKVSDDREEVARLFERYNLVSAPVVDDAGGLVGMITIDDIVDVIQEAADEDIKALGGVSPREELDDPLLSVARSRAVWLFVNLVTAFLASSVLALFQDQLQKMVALAILAPIVASQGGNAATQTMTVTVRALATRELSRANAWRIVVRELAVGLLNGFIFGIVTGIAAVLWFGIGALGGVIAAAMLTNLLAAALGGIAVPLGLDRLRIDPAVSSGAFVTTITDVVGYFSFLSFATIWFQLG
jgi:magnesium transporter